MPEPVFRTTEGRTPGTSEPIFDGDEHDTESPDDNAGDLAETLSDIKPDVTEPVIIKAAPPKQAKGCFQSFVLMFGVIGLSIVVILVALYYFLFYWRTTDTTF